MEDHIYFKDRKVPIVIRKSARAKNISLRVNAEGAITLSVPRRAPIHIARGFLQEKMWWLEERLAYLEKHPPLKPAMRFTRKHYNLHKDEALKFAQALVRHHNESYGFEYGKITVKNQKTRWGSCSKKGNLNFNYRVLFLPPELSDYIVVHELCHLQELNHSKKFWALVEKKFPHYKNLRKELKKQQM